MGTLLEKSPFAAAAHCDLALALAGLTHLLPAGTPLTAALAAKSAAAAVVWLAYVQLGGVYDLKELAAHLRPGK